MKPATALPWVRDEYGTVHPKTRPDGLSGVILSGFALSCGPRNEEAIQNTDYVFHAANNYPRLVQVLKAIAKPALGGKQQQYMAQAALKELGE